MLDVEVSITICYESQQECLTTTNVQLFVGGPICRLYEGLCSYEGQGHGLVLFLFLVFVLELLGCLMLCFSSSHLSYTVRCFFGLASLG